MAVMGHSRRNEAVGAVSGVPPIASEFCALRCGSMGHNRPPPPSRLPAISVVSPNSCQRDMPKSPLGKGSGDADGRRASRKLL